MPDPMSDIDSLIKRRQSGGVLDPAARLALKRDGTIRDYATSQRRPFLRFFACREDWSLASLDDPLPDAIAQGREPLIILGAIAGG